MLIGIILGSVLGVILLLVGLIGMIVSRQKRSSSRWPEWVTIAGGLAILTAVVNSMKLL